jgi:predicted nucleotidyltransferase
VITKHHSYHYFGFAETQWKLFDKERPRRVKPSLYVYRVLLTGIHLRRTGVVNANLVELNEEARLPYITDLIARKQSGCLRTATTRRSKTPMWRLISANTSVCAASCRRRMRRVGLRRIKRGRA